MRILALDQASLVTGWAIFEDEFLIKYGKISIENNLSAEERLKPLRDQVKNLIEQYNINKVILEDIYLDGQKVNNVKTFKTLAEVFGVLYELCTDLNIPVEAVLAGTWKSTLGIKGTTRPEQKRNAQLFIQNKYNIKVIQDIADAICIGEHYIQSQTNNWDE